MSKNILLIGDAGSGVDFIKNLCLLDPNIDKPEYINFKFLNDLYSKITFKNWPQYDNQTQYWNSRYGVDLCNNLNYNYYIKNQVNIHARAVFVNHSAFWNPKDLIPFQEEMDIVFLQPVSNPAILWQTRSYVEKTGVENLDNFSFSNRDIKQKEEYIENYGLDNYYKLNIMNMLDIRRKRLNEMSTLGLKTIEMDEVYAGSIRNTINQLNTTLNLSIPLKQAITLYNQWYSLHWNYNTTENWQWFLPQKHS